MSPMHCPEILFQLKSLTRWKREEDVAAHIDMIEASWPATAARLKQIRKATDEDEVLQKAIEYTIHGWPEKRDSVEQQLLRKETYLSLITYCYT